MTQVTYRILEGAQDKDGAIVTPEPMSQPRTVSFKGFCGVLTELAPDFVEANLASLRMAVKDLDSDVLVLCVADHKNPGIRHIWLAPPDALKLDKVEEGEMPAGDTKQMLNTKPFLGH